MTEIKDGFYADRKQKGVYRVHDVRRRAAFRLLLSRRAAAIRRTSSIPATIRPASRSQSSASSTHRSSRGPSAKISPPCSARRTRVFRLPTAAAASLYNEYGISKPYFFNRKEEKDHGEGGSLSAMSRRMAIKLLSSKTSSPPAPPCARPCRSSTAAAM